MSWATWLPFTGAHAWCVVLLCGVLGHLAPVHRRVRSVRCVACAVSWATWLLFTAVFARCAALFVCGVLGDWAPVLSCARSVCCVACAVSWASWLLFTGVASRCVVLRVRYPGPLGSLFFFRQTMFCVTADCAQEASPLYNGHPHSQVGVRGLASVGLLLWNNAVSVFGVHRRHLHEYLLLLSTWG